MRLINLLFIILFTSISFLLSAQEQINITIKAPSDIDSGRLDILLLDFGKIFAIEDDIPNEGLVYKRAVRGGHPKFQIIDTKTDVVYSILLKKKEGTISFSKDINSDTLRITTTDSLIVVNENDIYQDLFSHRRKNPNIKDLGILFMINPKEVNKSDSLHNRLLLMLKDLYTKEFEILKKYPSDYIAFDLFKDQVLVFKQFFPGDSIALDEFRDFMVSTFSKDIHSTPEFKKVLSELSGLDLKKEKPQQIDIHSLREDYLGEPFKISDIKSKFILIDFWATWCGPCILKIPSIKKLRDEFSTTDLEILGVSADHSLNNMRKGISDNSMNWRHIYDETRSIAEEFHVTAYPTLFLIDNEGRVLWSGEGFSENKLDRVREILLQK